MRPTLLLVTPFLASANNGNWRTAARWELGHVGWFQEYWCRRHAPSAPARIPSECGKPSRIANADALWDSARVPHDVRWSLPLPDWRAIDRLALEFLEAKLRVQQLGLDLRAQVAGAVAGLAGGALEHVLGL